MLDAGSLDPNKCSIGSEAEAFVPSLTSNQLASIFARGRVTDWRNLRYAPFPVTKNIYSQAAVAPLPQPGNRNIHVCSRTTGSGTMAAWQMNLEYAPCVATEPLVSSASQVIANESLLCGNGGCKIVHSMWESDGVEDCLEALDQGSAKAPSFVP
jgi:hypothetical protein